MPHLTLEYSSNIPEPADLQALLAGCHRIMADIGGILIDNCKSRAVSRENFHVGDGKTGGAFVHLDVKLLEGREPPVKQALGEALVALLRDTYSEISQSLDLQITVQIRDIQRGSYFKYPGGTLPSP